jgi:S-adenosylmethionine decarboxylase
VIGAAARATYGHHLLLRLSGIRDVGALERPEQVAECLRTLVQRVGMRVLAGPLIGQEEGPPEKRGCSGVVILYESHAAIHTYPALGEAFVDLFSCRAFDLDTVAGTLEAFFGPHRIAERTVLERGVHWSPDAARELDTWMRSR